MPTVPDHGPNGSGHIEDATGSPRKSEGNLALALCKPDVSFHQTRLSRIDTIFEPRPGIEAPATEIDHANRPSAADLEMNRNPRCDKHLRTRDFHDPRPAPMLALRAGVNRHFWHRKQKDPDMRNFKRWYPPGKQFAPLPRAHLLS